MTAAIITLALATCALAAIPFLITRRKPDHDTPDAPEAEIDRRAFRKSLGGWPE